MLNTVLLVIAILATMGVGWVVARRNRAAAPALAMAGVMLVAALAGPVWEWSKGSGGAGLPPHVEAPQFQQSLAAQAFLLAAIGAALGGVLVPRSTARIGNAGTERRPSERIKWALLGVGVAGFMLWIVGVGPAFFDREFYGQYNGNGFLLRVAFPLIAIVGIILLGTTGPEDGKRLRWSIYAVSVVWFIGLTSVGSRTALAFPVVAAVLFLRRGLNPRRFNPAAVFAAFLMFAVSVLTFAVVLQTRSMPHGVFNMPMVISTVMQNMTSSTDSYLMPLKQLLASVSASVPIAQQSAQYDVGLGVLLGNANILPGTAQPMELERYWPYEWVPLSFAGCWFGATGWLGQIGLFGFMSWVCCYSSYNLERSRFRFVAFIGLIFAVLISLLSLQYSSRMVWRVFSVALVTCVCAYLARERLTRPSLDVGNVSGDAGGVLSPAVALRR